MTPSNQPKYIWPELPPIDEWIDTYSTLHMWTQIVGKIRIELSPWLNHSWGGSTLRESKGVNNVSNSV